MSLRVLYIVHQFFPEFRTGTERFVMNVASMIQKAGNFVKIVTYNVCEGETFEEDGGIFAKEYFYKSLPVIGVKHKAAPVNLHTACEDSGIYNFASRFLKKERKYDLIHVGHPMRLISFTEAALESMVPYLLTLTDFWLICPRFVLKTNSEVLCDGPEGGDKCAILCREVPIELIKRRLSTAKDILFAAKEVVSPSIFLASVFKKEFPDLKIRIIPHGLDYRSVKENQRIYRNGGKIILGYCGSIQPHKGVHVLIRAFRELNPENAELKLYGKWEKDDYLRYLKDLVGEDNRIIFCGEYEGEKVGEVLNGIDVLIVPSLCYESYSFVIHEAFACNVPVIASNIGGLAEKVKESITGFTFRVGDHEDLATKLRNVVEESSQLNEVKWRMRGFLPPFMEEEAYLYERVYREMVKEMIPGNGLSKSPC